MGKKDIDVRMKYPVATMLTLYELSFPFNERLHEVIRKKVASRLEKDVEAISEGALAAAYGYVCDHIYETVRAVKEEGK